MPGNGFRPSGQKKNKKNEKYIFFVYLNYEFQRDLRSRENRTEHSNATSKQQIAISTTLSAKHRWEDTYVSPLAVRGLWVIFWQEQKNANVILY